MSSGCNILFVFVDLLEVVKLGYVLRWFGGWQLLDQASRDYHFRNPATLKVGKKIIETIESIFIRRFFRI